MTQTPNMGITEVVANQNNLDVTVNTALETIDAWIGSKTSAYIIVPNPLPTAITNATVGSNNVVVAMRLFIPHTIVVASISFYVSVLSAAKHASVGLYSADGNTRLIDSGPKSTASTGIQTTSVSPVVTVYPGWYWTARTSDDTTAAITGITFSDAGALAIINAGTVQLGTAANASAAGQLPTTLGAVSSSAQTVGIFKLQS